MTGVSALLHGIGLEHLPGLGFDHIPACFEALFGAGAKCFGFAQKTGYPKTVSCVSCYAAVHGLKVAKRVTHRNVVQPIGDYVGTRVLELKTGSWISKETRANAARLVFMDRLADSIMAPKPIAVNQPPRPLFAAFPDRAGQRYFMYIHASMPPCEVKPLKVVGNSVEWEVVQERLGSAPTSSVRPADPVSSEEKMILGNTPLYRQMKDRIDSSLTRSLVVIFQQFGSIKPVGFGIRIGRYDLLTAYHNVVQVGKSTPLMICGASQYEEEGEAVETHRLDSDCSVKALACDGRRSQTGFDACIVGVPELLFAKSGVSAYGNGIDHGATGAVHAVGFAPDCGTEFKPLVHHSGTLVEMRCLTAILGTVHHTISTVPGWSGTPVFRLHGETPKLTGLHIAAAPAGIELNIAVSAPLLARLLSESTRLPKEYLNCPLTCDDETLVMFKGEEDCPFDVRLNEVSTRTKMMRAEKDKMRAQHKKFKKASNSRANQRKRNKDKTHTSNKRHGGKTILARMSSRDYEKLKQAASLIADNSKACEETKRVYRKLLELAATTSRWVLPAALHGD